MMWLVIVSDNERNPLTVSYHAFKSESKADQYAMLCRDNFWRVAIIKLNFEDDTI